MNLCDNCIFAEECALAVAYAGEIIGCPKRKPITKADRIRAMSDEALAELFSKIENGGRNDHWLGKDGWLDWLRREAKND